MTNEKPLISVIVPVYKVEAYLCRCVDSVIDQTYPNLEIILVDDGSIDSCPQICDKYAENYSNVITLHKKNGGLSSARNYGVQHTKAELIAFVDSDDYVEKTYIEDMYKLMSKFKADLVITRVVREPEGSLKIKNNNKFPNFCTNSETALLETYSGGKVDWQAYGKLYHRETLLKNPFPDGYYEDCATMYKIINSVDRIAVGDYEGNYHYIDRCGSILRSELKQEHFRIFEICEEIENYLNHNYPQLYPLPIVMYARGVVQLLRLQSMSPEQYKIVYYKYQEMFRKNIFVIVNSKKVPRKMKLQILLMCLPCFLYKLIR